MKLPITMHEPWFARFDTAVGFIRDVLAGVGIAAVCLYVAYYFFWRV